MCRGRNSIQCFFPQRFSLKFYLLSNFCGTEHFVFLNAQSEKEEGNTPPSTTKITILFKRVTFFTRLYSAIKFLHISVISTAFIHQKKSLHDCDVNISSPPPSLPWPPSQKINGHTHLSVYSLRFIFFQDNFQTDPGQSEPASGPSAAPAGLVLVTGSGCCGTANPFLLHVSPVCQHHHHSGAPLAARTWGWKTEVRCLAGCTTSSCGETRDEKMLCLGSGRGCEGVALLCDFIAQTNKQQRKPFLSLFYFIHLIK